MENEELFHAYFMHVNEEKFATQHQGEKIRLIDSSEESDCDSNSPLKIVQVEVKQLCFDGVAKKLLSITDVSMALHREKEKVQQSFRVQLTESLAHEQINPLNTIVNVSQILQDKLKGSISERNKNTGMGV